MFVGETAFRPARNREEAKDVFQRSVRRIEVETHSYCNRRCDYCPNSVGDRLGENRRISEDIWALLLENLQEIDYDGNFIFASYNEPLADRLILRRIREAHARIPRAHLMIYTNGDYLDAAYLAELTATGLQYLHISIHCPPGQPFAEVSALNHIMQMAEKAGVAVRFRGIKVNEFIIADASTQEMTIEIRAINYRLHGTDRGGLVDGIAVPAARTLPCHFPFAHFHMGYAGTVVPCCHIRSDSQAHKAYQYGNLSEFGSIFEIYAGEKAAAWRRHLVSLEPKRPPCSTCSVAFLSKDPKVLEQAKQAWQRYGRNRPAAP